MWRLTAELNFPACTSIFRVQSLCPPLVLKQRLVIARVSTVLGEPYTSRVSTVLVMHTSIGPVKHNGETVFQQAWNGDNRECEDGLGWGHVGA